MRKKITGGSGFILNGIGWATKGTATHAPIMKIKEEKMIGPAPKK